MKEPIYLQHISLAEAAHELQQDQIAEQQVALWQLPEEEGRRVRTLFARTGIRTRRSAYDVWQPSTPLSVLRHWLELPIDIKMQEVYRPTARVLAKEAAHKALAGVSLEEVGAIITVSCTGLYAPGLEMDLVLDLGLPHDTKRYAVNFVGCYAVFPALDLARHVAQSLGGTAKPHVLLVAVELCSLHYHSTYTADAALAHALFADGAAACLVSAQKVDVKARAIGTYQNILVPAEQDMAWKLGDKHFLMQLSTYVPQLLAPTLQQVLPKAQDAHAYQMAIHPGGRRILEVAADAMSTGPETLHASYATMAQYGNMSSVTILYVLHELLKTADTRPILAAGFGPGLTLCSMELTQTTA